MNVLAMQTTPSESRPEVGSDLSSLIDAIGSERFGDELVGYLHRLCGADHCAVFQIGKDSLKQLSLGSLDGTNVGSEPASRYVSQQYWRRDPAMREAQSRVLSKEPALIRLDIGDLADSGLRDIIYPQIRERLVVAGCASQANYGLSILRTKARNRFSEADVARVARESSLLVSLSAKHANFALGEPNASSALSSLAEIEDCVVDMTELPRREAQVCARALYGLSTPGIAVDLEIGEESVKTYRKRAYLRLNIGCSRELLSWYLARWSEWKRQLRVGTRTRSGRGARGCDDGVSVPALALAPQAQ